MDNSYTYRLICNCEEQIVKEIVNYWWKEVDYPKKELWDDSLPKRFHGTFRIGYIYGEYRVHSDFSIKKKDTLSILTINLLFPLMSKHNHFQRVQEIVCWFISEFKERKIQTELKYRIFSKKIEC